MTFDEALKLHRPNVKRPIQLFPWYSGNSKDRRKRARRQVIESAKQSKERYERANNL